MIGKDIYENEVPLFIDVVFAEEKFAEFIKNKKIP